MINISFVKLNEKAIQPVYKTSGAAGMDVSACLSESVKIEPLGGIALIPTGIAIELPEGYEAQLRPRSGLALKNAVTLPNSPATIDSDYRGEIKIIVINHGKEPFVVNHGDRIAQMVIAKVEQATLTEKKSLNTTNRGEGGFGHTGVS